MSELMFTGIEQIPVSNPLRAYMLYSGNQGKGEGAILVFAESVKQAKKLGYVALYYLSIVEEYTDVRATWLRYDYIFAHANKEKLDARIPHIIEPAASLCCDVWGYYVDESGLCEECEQFAGNKAKAIAEIMVNQIRTQVLESVKTTLLNTTF